jgi:hypothetical protein
MQLERTPARAMSSAIDCDRPTMPSLADIADQARGAGEVDEAAGLLLTEIGRCRLRDIEGAVEVHVDHRAPVLMAHLVPDRVTQDPGVVDHGIDPPEPLDRILDDRGGARRIVHESQIGPGLTAGRNDVVDRFLRRALIAALTAAADAGIVDHHGGAVLGAEQRDLPPHAAPRAGHRDNLALKHSHHRLRILNRSINP